MCVTSRQLSLVFLVVTNYQKKDLSVKESKLNKHASDYVDNGTASEVEIVDINNNLNSYFNKKRSQLKPISMLLEAAQVVAAAEEEKALLVYWNEQRQPTPLDLLLKAAQVIHAAEEKKELVELVEESLLKLSKF